MTHIVEMGEDTPRFPRVAANLSNRFLHEPEMRRQALRAFLCNAFPVATEFVDYDARDDEREHAALHHFLDDAEHRFLLLILRKVKPYAGVDQHSEHGVSLQDARRRLPQSHGRCPTTRRFSAPPRHPLAPLEPPA